MDCWLIALVSSFPLFLAFVAFVEDYRTLRGTAADFAILDVLRDVPSYGRRVCKDVNERQPLGGKYIREHAICPLLRDLERRGLVTVSASLPCFGRGGRPRYYYSITEAGRAYLGDYGLRL